jgi:hypothetical protein
MFVEETLTVSIHAGVFGHVDSLVEECASLWSRVHSPLWYYLFAGEALCRPSVMDVMCTRANGYKQQPLP